MSEAEKSVVRSILRERIDSWEIAQVPYKQAVIDELKGILNKLDRLTGEETTCQNEETHSTTQC